MNVNLYYFKILKVEPFRIQLEL